MANSAKRASPCLQGRTVVLKRQLAHRKRLVFAYIDRWNFGGTGNRRFLLPVSQPEPLILSPWGSRKPPWIRSSDHLLPGKRVTVVFSNVPVEGVLSWLTPATAEYHHSKKTLLTGTQQNSW